MKIELQKYTVGEVAEGYEENIQTGEVVGYGGKLNIRPAFQREFVYNEKQRNEVIKTLIKGFPLNTMYWVKNPDGTFEMLDGQQRTISFCKFVNGHFSIGGRNSKISDHRTFHNLSKTEQKNILDYELQIYVCEGDDKEKLDWFEVINIAGVELTKQELRNAIFSCEWTTDAKKYFSRKRCEAVVYYGNYLKGVAIRQDFLETALKWICDAKNLEDVSDYMNIQKANGTKTAEELWNYFEKVFAWVQKIFPKYRKEMKGLQWGIFYNKYGEKFNESFEEKVADLMKNLEIQKKSGIYEYLLSGEEKHLNLRTFDDYIKSTIYEQQGGKCAICGKSFEISEMHADHIKAWSKGGKTVAENCQMLCRDCNLKKSNK